MPQVVPRALCIGIYCGVLGLARAASAQPLPIDLSWDAPLECPSHDEVMAELSRITRLKPGRVVTRIRAQAIIERAADRLYKLRLRTQRDDQTGDTELAAGSCAALERGVTLVLALALGDGVDLVDENGPPPVATPPAPPEAPAPPKVARAAPEPPVPAREAPPSLRWSPWLAAAGSWGLLAKPALGAELGLTSGQQYWQGEARVTFWPVGSAQPLSGIDSSFLALVGALSACGRLPLRSATALAVCGQLDVGAIHGRAHGATQDGSATAPWYAVGPSVALTTPCYGPARLRVEAGLNVGFDPPHFAIRGLREVYVVARYVPVVSLGMAF